MQSKGKYHEEDFETTDYKEFYEDHYFQPLSDTDAVNAHRVLPRVRWALSVAKEIQPKAVLDLGCLEGYGVLTLAKNVESVEHGVGVDLSKQGIELADERAKKNKLPVHFVQGYAEDFLETHNAPDFDLIMAFELIEHVENPERLFDLIDKVAAPGATVLLSTPDFESPYYGKDDERNKCHVRLYTTDRNDYFAINKYGNKRMATSLSKQLGPNRKIVSMEVKSELINCRYTVPK